MPKGAPSHEPLATNSGRAECALYRRRQPGQRLDQSAEEESNESTKMRRGRSIKGGKLVSVQRYRAWRRRRSKPEGEASWEGSEGGKEGV
jgi:hypothetical protein